MEELYSMEMHRTFDELIEKNGGYEFIGVCMEGIKNKYPLCCIFFFMSGWKYIQENIYEYRFDNLARNRIICPSCIVNMLGDRRKK